MVRVPRGVRILDIEPSRVPVQLEEVRTLSLPVRVARNGGLPDGYRVAGIVVAPESVTVTGPASAVANLEAVETEPLELAGLTTSTRRALGLVRGERLYAITPERVTVQVTVEQVRKTRELRAAVEVLNVDRPFQLRPPHVNLTVRGPEASVRELNLEAGAVSVDGADLGVGTHTVAVAVVVPAGIELVKTEPDKLSLQILEKKTGARR
jgi:YbbR domain-containing protein